MSRILEYHSNEKVLELPTRERCCWKNVAANVQFVKNAKKEANAEKPRMPVLKLLT